MVQVVVKASSESQGVLVAIFPVKSLLQEWKSLWECILSKPVSEEFKFHPTDCPEKFLSGQSAHLWESPIMKKEMINSNVLIICYIFIR